MRVDDLRSPKFGAAWILVTADTNVAHIKDAVGGSVGDGHVAPIGTIPSRLHIYK